MKPNLEKIAVCQICNNSFPTRNDCKSVACSTICGQQLVIQKSKLRAKLLYEKNKSEYDSNPNSCSECFSIIHYDFRKNKFCSKSCSASHSNKLRGARPIETKQRISNALAEITEDEYKHNPNTCQYCFALLPYSKRKNLFCGKKCAGHFHIENHDFDSKRKIIPCVKCNVLVDSHFLASSAICDNCLSLYESYRRKCKFKFNERKFVDWFNLQENCNDPEIHKYKLSRDHMFSVYDGYHFKIDPKIISHPANCKFLTISENASKNKSSSITLAELYVLIEKFDRIYKKD